MREEQLRRDALEYHSVPTSGKISVTPTKSLVNQRDLALAYSPGVAYACLAIRDDPKEAATLTSRANLVAVITNGSAVLGLGNIGALAGKPVHILTQSATVRGILNMTALAAADAIEINAGAPTKPVAM